MVTSVKLETINKIFEISTYQINWFINSVITMVITRFRAPICDPYVSNHLVVEFPNKVTPFVFTMYLLIFFLPSVSPSLHISHDTLRSPPCPLLG